MRQLGVVELELNYDQAEYWLSLLLEQSSRDQGAREDAKWLQEQMERRWPSEVSE